MQGASQRLTSVALGLPGHAGIRCTIEAVIRPRIQVQLDRYSGAAQSIRIGQVFFKEEIETADRNVGWRQARTAAARAAAAEGETPAEPGSSPSSERQPK